jgi:hypothetical protein
VLSPPPKPERFLRESMVSRRRSGDEREWGNGGA